MNISRDDKKLLLLLAQRVVINCLMPGKAENHNLPDPVDSLQVNCGAFVSLYIMKKLRGCIGTFSEEETLYNNIKNMTVSAATSDSRFAAIEPHELKHLNIEISVLTPRWRIYNKNEIILGKHGIYIEDGIKRGTFLPQVATNQDWSVEEFLGNCAKNKAGIGWNGWKTARLFIYEAIVFNALDMGQSVPIP